LSLNTTLLGLALAPGSGSQLHAEQVPEIGQEPNYDAALAKL
jgi:hypothetical protein